MIRLSGTLTCADARQAETLRDLLPGHVTATLAEPGCLSFRVEPTADPLVWTVDEAFTDDDAFRAHQARTQATRWGRETVAIGRDYRMTRDDDPAPPGE